MSVFDLFNAAFGYGSVPSSSTVKGVAPQSATKGTASNGVPSFGIKGRPELTSDKFEKSGEAQQPMVSYRGKKVSLEQAKTDSYKRVNDHEESHLRAAKGLANNKVIEYDANGIAISGHVNIKIPTAVNKKNPDETIEQTEIAMASASAPETIGDEMSQEDKNTFALASAIHAEAKSFKAQKGNNPFAKNPFANIS